MLIPNLQTLDPKPQAPNTKTQNPKPNSRPQTPDPKAQTRNPKSATGRAHVLSVPCHPLIRELSFSFRSGNGHYFIFRISDLVLISGSLVMLKHSCSTFLCPFLTEKLVFPDKGRNSVASKQAFCIRKSHESAKLSQLIAR